VLPVNVYVRHRKDRIAHDLFFQRRAGLLHSRGNKAWSERRDLVRYTLIESQGKGAVRRSRSALHQRVGIGREHLMIVVIRVVEE